MKRVKNRIDVEDIKLVKLWGWGDVRVLILFMIFQNDSLGTLEGRKELIIKVNHCDGSMAGALLCCAGAG